MTHRENSVLEKGVDSLKRGLAATMDRLDQFLSHQKKDHARIQEIQQELEKIRRQAFGTQKISDEDVLKYFQQTEEKIHSMDARKQLKFPDRSPPSKTNAINTPDAETEGQGKP